MRAPTTDRRPWTFYVLAAVFTLFVLFLYGPMACIYILSFQGPNGGLTFPLNGVSTDWFGALFYQQRTGDIAGAFSRSIPLALIVDFAYKTRYALGLEDGERYLIRLCTLN